MSGSDEADDVTTVSSVRSADSLRERAGQWLVLEGDRMYVTAGLAAVVFAVLFALLRTGVLTASPEGSMATLLSSGLTSGLLTLVTVALSINQLILSRVFGSPDELLDRLEGTRDLRGRVEDAAATSSTPNDPASFLKLVAGTLADRARALQDVVADAGDVPADVEDHIGDVVEYGENIDDRIEGQTAVVDVLAVVLGTEYAQNLTAISHFREEYADALPDDADAEFDAVSDLLEAIAVARQFFKTLLLQQDFARLSRFVAFSGFLAFLSVVSLTLVYRTNSVTVPRALLPWVASVGLTVIATPLAALVAYIVRAATVAQHTVSVGPFVPPKERQEDG